MIVFTHEMGLRDQGRRPRRLHGRRPRRRGHAEDRVLRCAAERTGEALSVEDPAAL